MPIWAVTQQFSFSKNRIRNADLIGEKEQFPLAVAHAMTVHNSQGSTVAYLAGDIGQAKTLRINAKLMKICFILFCIVPQQVI